MIEFLDMNLIATDDSVLLFFHGRFPFYADGRRIDRYDIHFLRVTRHYRGAVQMYQSIRVFRIKDAVRREETIQDTIQDQSTNQSVSQLIKKSQLSFIHSSIHPFIHSLSHTHTKRPQKIEVKI